MRFLSPQSAFSSAVLRSSPNRLRSTKKLFMKKSQDRASVQEANKRVRRTKDVLLEPTVQDDSEEALELSKNLTKGRKVTAGAGRKKIVEQQEPKEKKTRSRADKKDVFTEKDQSDWQSSSSDKYSEDKRGWRAEEAVPSTGYEWLGLRTIEPVSRPPILHLNSSNSARVAWAAKDCTLSGTVLRRARPTRPLEAVFYDRVEAMRRVALSEVAKAKDGMQAIAVLGVIFDRELLMLAAEEVYGQVRGKTMVMDAAPGSYEELAANIASDKRLRRFSKRRDGGSRVETQRVSRGMSKPTPPYVSTPFPQGGTKVLYKPWCPREEGLHAPR